MEDEVYIELDDALVKRATNILNKAKKERGLVLEHMEGVDEEEIVKKYCCVCDERVLSQSYEAMSYGMLEDEDVTAEGMSLMRNKKPTANVVIQRLTGKEGRLILLAANGLRLPTYNNWAEITTLCSHEGFRTGQARILMMLALWYLYLAYDIHRVYLKYAHKNKAKLVPYYESFGFHEVVGMKGTSVMINIDTRKILKNYNYASLLLKYKSARRPRRKRSRPRGKPRSKPRRKIRSAHR